MRGLITSALGAATLALSAVPAAAVTPELADPFTGTGARSPEGDPGLVEAPGSTFPGAAVPFGMVQLSPDTERGGGAEVRDAPTGGYRFSHRAIRGFSHTHLSGAGCNRKRTLGDVPFLPTVGPIAPRTEPLEDALGGDNLAREAARQLPLAPFDHALEDASPGAYSTTVGPVPVRAELTATERTGWHRYTFPPTSQANVLVDVGTTLSHLGSEDAAIDVVGDRRLEGWVRAGDFCGPSDYTVHFAAEFDRPFSDSGTWNGGRGPQGGGWVRFDATADRDVVAKVALSYVSIDGARANLAAETDRHGFAFDAVRAQARTRWAAELDRVGVRGGTDGERRTFATALYHAFLQPTLFSDADRRYRGPDGGVRRADHDVYTQFSLWDTYRGHAQLLGLLVPDRARDMLRSLVRMHEDGGWLPKWALAGQDSGNMSGDPVTPMLTDGALKGLLRGRDRERAWAALWENATRLPPAGSISRGRRGLPEYDRLGYVPTPYPSEGAGASITLEYALADCSLARLARQTGRTAEEAFLRRRAASWRTLLDPATGLIRPRDGSGAFKEPFDPSSHDGFAQGSAVQYTWLVPHDAAGLVAALGGREATSRRLDTFFTRGEWGRPDRFDLANEPTFATPYLYAWTGEPGKIGPVTRDGLAQFRTGPDGLPGNEDLGAMSAWYVWSALGLYPAIPGSDAYVLTAPLFERADVRLGSGRTLTVRAPGASRERAHVRGASLDGRAASRAWLGHGALRRGGDLRMELGEAADPTWATGPADEPPSPCGSG